MTLRVLSFFALVFTAVALIPVGAHLFALPNKIGMAQQPYFIAQSVYYGWALLGLVLVPAVLIDAGLAMMLRCEGLAFKLAAAGSLCMAATLVIFFIWVYPANVATQNWTAVPADWQVLRWQWEWGHAIDAVLTFVAFCLIAWAALLPRRR